MCQKVIITLLLCVAGIVQKTSAQQAWRILPGKAIGFTYLGQPADSLAKVLGNADGGDAAMGKAWAVYYNKDAHRHIRDSSRFLAVYLTRDEPVGMRVRQIRVNTPSFRANNDVKVGVSLAKIRANFPNLLRAGIYQDTVTHIRYYLYDAVHQGIAFEISAGSNTCTAITVHDTAKTIAGTYLTVPGNERMKKVQ